MNTSTQPDLSPHRHISFTAHYTGYIWYLLGISHPALASRKGKRLASFLHPLETLAERFVGGSMRSTLRQRHQLIDRELNNLISQYPNLQVVEIAAGLSPRGWRYRQQYPNISYIEMDLPDMATAKRQALATIDPQATIIGVDLFSSAFKQHIQALDHQRPLVIISEGLVNYFNKDMLSQLWQSFSSVLAAFKAGYYISDIYPEPIKHKLAKLIWNSSKLLKVLSKSAFAFHFQSPTEAQDFLINAGFKTIDIYQPKDDKNNQHAEHLGDLVWVFTAKAS